MKEKESFKKSKFFCLNCLKTFKSPGNCCSLPLFRISNKARPPKKTANKTQWRSFFQLFLTGEAADKDQLKRIISIRTEYGLSIYSQQLAYNKMVEQYEASFKFLDIKRGEALVSVWIQPGDSLMNVFIKNINNLISHYTEHKTTKKFNLNKKYFMVSIHATEGYLKIFPSSLDKYGLFKVSVSFQPSADRYLFKIITNDIGEEYPEYKATTSFNTQYSVRQGFLIFDTKEEAMAFRFKYLSLLAIFLKHQQNSLFNKLLKEATADYNRVARKSPQLLI